MHQQVVCDLQVDHRVELGKFVQRFRLGNRARESVEQISVGTVVFRESVADNAHHHIVGHERALFDVALRFKTGRGLLADRTAENLPRADLRNTQAVDDFFCLRALSRTGRAEEYDLHAATSCSSGLIS